MTRGLSPEDRATLKHMHFRKTLSQKDGKIYDQFVKMTYKAIKEGRGEEFLKKLKAI